ncbi:MAG: hypothetical protein QOH76_3499 [Thermoleophilaceae bacterium]|nr:hypothetical protein [Thermoleophilaceae bacterium]
MAEEREDKPEGEDGAARETAVGHPVVEADAAAAGATEVHYTADPGAPQPAPAPTAESGGTSPAAADRQAADAHDPFVQKPELFVAGAFVGAFVVAKLLKKLTGGGD